MAILQQISPQQFSYNLRLDRIVPNLIVQGLSIREIIVKQSL